MQVRVSWPSQLDFFTDKRCRASSVRMKVFFNAHDRETGEWPELFLRADPRFRIVVNKFHRREPNNDVGPTLALVEAMFEG